MSSAEIFSNSEKREGKQEEMYEEVWPGDDGEEFPKGVEGSSSFKE
jgi:hypothetical protein